MPVTKQKTITARINSDIGDVKRVWKSSLWRRDRAPGINNRHSSETSFPLLAFIPFISQETTMLLYWFKWTTFYKYRSRLLASLCFSLFLWDITSPSKESISSKSEVGSWRCGIAAEVASDDSFFRVVCVKNACHEYVNIGQHSWTCD
jgi:hypothetical protein